MKKAMRTEVIPVIATPSMNHRVIMSKDLADVSASEDQNGGYVSSGKSLRYSARLKVSSHGALQNDGQMIIMKIHNNHN